MSLVVMEIDSCATGVKRAPPRAALGLTSQKLSTVECERHALGISRARLAARADISGFWYGRILREPHRASPATIQKLEQALRDLAGMPRRDDARDREAAHNRALVLAHYDGLLAAIAPFYGVSPADVRASDPKAGQTADKHWRACAHARQAALYLVNTAYGRPQRQIAQALGLTPAAVCLALKAVEDRRGDPAFNAALEAAQRDVTGACDG